MTRLTTIFAVGLVILAAIAVVLGHSAAFLMGALQGVTEFLPISSSGHLILLPWLFGWQDPLLNSLTFDVALHIGTLVAVIAYFGVIGWRCSTQCPTSRDRSNRNQR